MTRCSPHYPSRRWTQCSMELPASAGVRILIRDRVRVMRWESLTSCPYRFRPGHNDIYFPRWLRRDKQPHGHRLFLFRHALGAYSR